MKRLSFQGALLLIGLLTINPGYSAIYYVAPTGSDANSGTIASPFLTIQRGQTSATAGDTVYIRGGLYSMQESQIAAFSGTNPVFAFVTNLTKSGSSGNRIKYWAYPGEKPVFDYSNVRPLNTRINAFEISGAWIHIKGLEVIGVQVTTAQNINTQSICFSQSGAGGNNIYEQLSMHDGMAIGFYLTRGGNTLVLNCDAYNNWDNVSGNQVGGNVDGFGAHPNNMSYSGIVFRGCRAWYNSDDGYDCINSYAPVIFENCWAWRNGYSTTGQSLGDGNGFKAGGYGVSTTPSVPATIPRNIIQNCMAANNKASGFYANHHLGGNDWYNNTSYRNSVNFNMLNRSSNYQSDVPGYDHVIRNNISFSARSSNSDITNYNAQQCTIDHNSFLNSAVSVSSADFISLDTSLVRATRNTDGSLPNTNLLRLVSSSDLIDAGINVGLPFNGTAPDLGCFETLPGTLPVNMISFIATVVQKTVILKWVVDNEIRNKGWSVERASPGNNLWETVGFVNSTGRSNEKTTYSYTDRNVSSGKYLYRLKQVDLDGSSKYSSVQTVSLFNSKTSSLNIYPIPVNAGSVVSYSVPTKSRVSISLFNSYGVLIATLLNEDKEAGQFQLPLKMPLLNVSGTYILKFSADENVYTKTFIKSN